MTIDERDLHERLEAAFRAISPRPAPIDDAMRGGRAIRVRRRVALAVGVAAVAAAAVFSVPALLYRTASPAPTSPARQYTVTVQPPGPDAQTGLIASGTIDGQLWFVLADRPGVDGAPAGQQIIIAGGTGVGALAGADLDVPTLGTGRGPGPVLFISSSFGTAAQIQVGAVQADVSYVTVRLGNGTVLVLHPAAVYGTRAVAFAAPIKAEITEVTAYSRHGEIASAVPFNWPGGTAWVISWLRPGQVPTPRVSGVIGSGTVRGKAWSATAYLGPWGTCIAPDGAAAQGGLCVAGRSRGERGRSARSGPHSADSGRGRAGLGDPRGPHRTRWYDGPGPAGHGRRPEAVRGRAAPGPQAAALDRLRQRREGGHVVGPLTRL